MRPFFPSQKVKTNMSDQTLQSILSQLLCIVLRTVLYIVRQKAIPVLCEMFVNITNGTIHICWKQRRHNYFSSLHLNKISISKGQL